MQLSKSRAQLGFAWIQNILIVLDSLIMLVLSVTLIFPPRSALLMAKLQVYYGGLCFNINFLFPLRLGRNCMELIVCNY